MKNALSIVTLSVALSACTTWSARPANEVGKASASDLVASNGTPSLLHKTSAPVGESAPQDPLPAVELTPDLLYKLLAAEIAYQRGDWESAYATTLSAAQHTRDPRLARRAAQMAIGAKDPEEALTAVELWRELAPHSEEATQYYLSFMILKGNFDDARPILQQRLAQASGQTRTLLAFQLQRLLAHAQDKAAAFALLQELLAPYSSTPEMHLALAQGAAAAGNSALAQQEAHTALKADPASELAVLTLAQVTPGKQDAARILADFLKQHPKSHDVRIAYARMMIEEKHYDEARQAFREELAQRPDDLTSLYALGVLGLQTNDLDTAEHYLTAYLDALTAQKDAERDPSQALLLLAQIAEERHDTKSELKWLGEIGPGEAYLGAQIKRAQLVAKSGDVEAARRILEEINPDDEAGQIQVALAEGQILRDAGRLPQAMTVFREALKRYPDNTDLLYDYAMTAEKGNHLKIMETALRKVIRLAPDNQNAYNALGYSFADRNMRLGEAHSLIEKALKLAPNDPYIIDSMGWVEFRQGKLKEAESLLRRAYTLRPDVEIAAHLGEVLWVRGHKQDAEKFWRDAQIRDPDNGTLKSTLARLNVNL